MQEMQRRAVARLARETHVRFVGLFLIAGLAIRLTRIADRKHDASDATRDVALKQETTAIGALDWHVVDASGTPDDTLRRSVCYLSEGRCEPDLDVEQ